MSIIGRGAFGEVSPSFIHIFWKLAKKKIPLFKVRVAKMKSTGQVYAIKIMKKSEMVKKNQVTHIQAEKDVLALADAKYVVQLSYSFQVSSMNNTF